MDQLIDNYNVRLFNITNAVEPCLINKHVHKIYVIHLESAKLRRKYIEILMKKLKLNYTAVVVKPPTKFIYNRLLYLSNKHVRKMTLGEAGCFLSHMWCLKHICNKNYKNVLILEDDIVIHKNFMDLYKTIVTQKEYDFLMLGAADHGFNKGNKELVKNNVYIPKHHVIMGTHAIYYSRHGAKTVYDHKKKSPVYFDRNLKELFYMFNKNKTGVCCPNLCTVENSTSHLNHNFGITRYEKNDYYYNQCYFNFDFNDYHFIYLDLFSKYMLESDSNTITNKVDFIKSLLLNYFNNDIKLMEFHLEKLSVHFFTIKEYSDLLNASKDFITRLYYVNYKDLCKKHGVTSGKLIKDKIPRSNTNISKLFYKQHLDPEIIHRGFRYNIIKEVPFKKKYIAHIHCFHLGLFDMIYDKYMLDIKKHFDVIVTYCNSVFENIENMPDTLKDCIIIKCENRGMDIGAKHVIIDCLKKKKYSYDYILFLHSKSCEKSRKLYFNSLLGNIEYICNKMNENIVGGFFPPTIHSGNDQIMIYNDKYLQSDKLKNVIHIPFNTLNAVTIHELTTYFGISNKNITLWPSGNCYCLHKNIAERLFGDYKIYNCLNCKDIDSEEGIECFDYNWVMRYYNIPFKDVEFVYEVHKYLDYKGNFLQLEDKKKLLRDGMVEHAFERILFLMVTNTKNKNNDPFTLEILPNGVQKNKDQIQHLSNELNKYYKIQHSQEPH